MPYACQRLSRSAQKDALVQPVRSTRRARPVPVPATAYGAAACPQQPVASCSGRSWASAAYEHAPLGGPTAVGAPSGGVRPRVAARAARGGARGGRAPLTCRASLPEGVDSAIRTVTVASSIAGISYAVLLAAVSEPKKPAPGAEAGGDDGFVWGLMGFISCLPLFNWLAWVLAAISNEERAVLYLTYAGLYLAPFVTRGLDWQDPWALSVLALGAVHVQLERVAQTEPQTLQAIKPVGVVGSLLRGSVKASGSYLSGLGKVLVSDSKKALDAPRRGGERMEVDDRGAAAGEGAEPDAEVEDYSRRELELFDQQIKEREEQRKRGGTKGGRG